MMPISMVDMKNDQFKHNAQRESLFFQAKQTDGLPITHVDQKCVQQTYHILGATTLDSMNLAED